MDPVRAWQDGDVAGATGIAKMLEHFAKRSCRALGYELIPAWRLGRRDFAQHLSDLFARVDIDLVLDVGANMGQFRDFLRHHVGYAGQIVSFEPISDIADALAERATSDSKWQVIRCALGSSAGERELNIAKSPQLSSFLAATQSGVKIIDEGNVLVSIDERNVVTRKEVVPVLTLAGALDSIEQEAANEASHIYVKLDTQGFDFEILRGAEAYLSRFSALQTELSFIPLYHGSPDFCEVLPWLTARGFHVTGMYPVGRDDALRLTEVDCVLVNHDELRNRLTNRPTPA
jgi:FkbM family methyltransferase